MPSQKTNVLILGCGLGGSTLAVRLAGKVRKHANIRVIERRQNLQLPAAFQWVMMGWRKPSEVQRSLRPLARKGIDLVNDSVEKISIQKKIVKTKTGDYSYDHLIIATGAEYATGLIPGFEEYANHSYDLEHAVKFRDHVQNFKGGTLVVAISRIPFKCPPAPYEAALLLEQHLRSTGRKSTVQIFTPELQPLPAAGPVIGRQMLKLLENRGLSYKPKTILKRIEKNRIIFDNGEAQYDLLYAVPPHVCPKPIVEAGLTDSSGWVPINPQTLTTKYENVYGLGDVTSVETAHGHVPFLPKAGVFALGQAEVLADNLAAKIAGESQTTSWNGNGHCFLATGGEEAAFLQGSFLSNPPRLEFHTPSQKWYQDRLTFEKEVLHGKF